MRNKFFRVTDLAWEFLKEIIKLGDTVVDATAGNGNDTLRLARQVGEQGLVLAFDIQKEAIEATESLLVKNKMKKQVNLICDNHCLLNYYLDNEKIKAIKAMIVNLGYLPGGSKEITTHAESSIKLLKDALVRLESGGMITVCLYSGHEQGKRETELILEWAEKLEKPFLAHYFKTLNRDCPPTLLILQRAGERKL